MRSSDHWVNGVNEDELLDMVSLTEGVLQSKVIDHWTIFKLELGEMESGSEGQLIILHHANRGKVDEYYQGAIKNSLVIFKV